MMKLATLKQVTVFRLIVINKKKKQKFSTSTFWSVASVYIMSRKAVHCSEIYISHCESAFFIQWAILWENDLCVTQEYGL